MKLVHTMFYLGMVMASYSAVRVESHWLQELVTNGHFKEALAKGAQADHLTVDDAAVLGFCAQQEGALGEAVWYWRCAQQGASFSHYLALQEAIDGALKAPERSWVSHGELLLVAVPLIWLQLAFLLVWLLLVWSMQGWAEPWRRRLGLTALVLLLLLSGPVIYRYLHDRKPACVVMTAASLRSGPAETFVELRSLTPGQQARVEAEFGATEQVAFYKIQTDAIRGWISKKAIKLIKL